MKEEQKRKWKAQEAEREESGDAAGTGKKLPTNTGVVEIEEAANSSPGFFRRIFERGDLSPRLLGRRLSIQSDAGESSTSTHTRRWSASDLFNLSLPSV